ncbi:Imidazole glycerol phosphate synthase amidotransferase subunit [hydrothermal vent metagenome]|uniref:Imidazole glycerol phosphate synthase amidotransferase subunit n=1 Tax=hydrothermal vent metagenome TaxID=652676 RepID=A0A3B1B7D6_9ZZZZ
MNRVAVIDYGMGNLHSVAKALEHVSDKVDVIVTAEAGAILQADRVVLPGVGAIRDCMAEIRRLKLDQVVQEVANSGRPLLGVCVGMQAMLDFSEENGGTDCLGFFPGRVEYFGDDLRDVDTGEKLKIPHMGWNQVHQEVAHPLWENIAQDARFYFVHSYFVHPAEQELISATTEYGCRFSVALARDNVFAVQFHPEKSQHDGLQLYQNFLNWKP